MRSSALPPSRIIERDSRVPATFDPRADANSRDFLSHPTTALMRSPTSPPGRDFADILVFNKSATSLERLCPACFTRYRALPEAAAQAAGALELERLQSGICSAACWQRLNAGNGFSLEAGGAGDEWFGQSGTSVIDLQTGTGIVTRADGGIVTTDSLLVGGASSSVLASGEVRNYTAAGGVGAPACDVCGSAADTICGACRSRRYCGRACQRADWRAHKPACGRVRRAIDAAAEFHAEVHASAQE